MGLGKKNEEFDGLGLVRSTSYGRKRVTLNLDFIPTTPRKKVFSGQNSFSCYDKSPLEALPQDILIRILCGVDHDDLKRLFHVSRAVREATLIAKRFHFEYSTPRKTLAFKNAIEDLGDFSEVEAPNAPKQSKFRSRLSGKKLADISVALFTSDGDDEGEENRMQSELCMKMEAEL